MVMAGSKSEYRSSPVTVYVAGLLSKFFTWKLRMAVQAVGVGANANDRLPGHATEVARADWNASTRPDPITVAGTGWISVLSFMFRFAWFISTALIWAGLQFGCSWRSRTATPETCGAAIEVPDRATASLPVPTAAASIADPGAEMSGFRSFVSRAGPSDVKLVIASIERRARLGTSEIVR